MFSGGIDKQHRAVGLTLEKPEGPVFHYGFTVAKYLAFWTDYFGR